MKTYGDLLFHFYDDFRNFSRLSSVPPRRPPHLVSLHRCYVCNPRSGMCKGCGHCKKLAPALSEAAKKIKDVDEKIVFAKVTRALGAVLLVGVATAAAADGSVVGIAADGGVVVIVIYLVVVVVVVEVAVAPVGVSLVSPSGTS